MRGRSPCGLLYLNYFSPLKNSIKCPPAEQSIHFFRLVSTYLLPYYNENYNNTY